MAGDLAGAIATLERIAQDAVDVAGAVPGEWGGAEWTLTEAQHMIAMLSRIAITRQLDAGHHPMWLPDTGFVRLGALVATLPADTAARAVEVMQAQQRELQALLASIEATAGPAAADGSAGAMAGPDPVGVAVSAEMRVQLERLIRSGAPEQVVRDIQDLAARGELTADDLRVLLGVGQWKGHAGPAQAIGQFAATHGLEWSPATKKRFRAALRELPAEPVTPVVGAVQDGAGFAPGSLEALLLRAMGGQQRRTADEVMAGLPWWMPASWRDAVIERVRQGAVDGFRYSERTVSRKPVGYIHRTEVTEEPSGRPATGRGWLRTALVTAAAGAVAGGAFTLLGMASLAALAGGSAVAAVVAMAVGTYRYVRASRGPPPFTTTLVGTFVVLTTGLGMAGVGPVAVVAALGGAVIGSAVVRWLPVVRAVLWQRGALVAGLAANAGLAGRGGFPARIAARVQVMRELRRDLAAVRASEAAAQQRVLDDRELVAASTRSSTPRCARASAGCSTRRTGASAVRPSARPSRGCSACRGQLVDSYAIDPAIPVDTPVAVGAAPDRFQRFAVDLALVKRRGAGPGAGAGAGRAAAGRWHRRRAGRGGRHPCGVRGRRAAGAGAAAGRRRRVRLGAGHRPGGRAGRRGRRRRGWRQRADRSGRGRGRPERHHAHRLRRCRAAEHRARGARPAHGQPDPRPAVTGPTQPVRCRPCAARRPARAQPLRQLFADVDRGLQEALAENRELRERFEEQAGGLRPSSAVRLSRCPPSWRGTWRGRTRSWPTRWSSAGWSRPSSPRGSRLRCGRRVPPGSSTRC